MFGSNILFEWGYLEAPPLDRRIRWFQVLVFFLTACLSTLLFGLVYSYILVPFGLRTLLPVLFILFLVGIDTGVKRLARQTAFGKNLQEAITSSGRIPYQLVVYAILMLAVSFGSGVLHFILVTLYAILAYAASTVLLDDIMDRLDHEPIPSSFKGLPIRLFSAGLIAMVFTGIDMVVRPALY